MKHLTLKIHGKVQGVFFRNNAQKIAQKLGIFGWAKNNPDGSVSLEVEGEEPVLEKFLAWSKNGPQSAQVDEIEIAWSDKLSGYRNFEIKR